MTANSLVMVRSGRFSGSAISLRDELRQADVPVVDVDLQRLGYDFGLAVGRACAMGEARLGGANIPWSRTASWAAAVGRRCTRLGVLAGQAPVLFVQSATPVQMPRGRQYLVYTDRVGAEGVVFGGRYRSRHTAWWRSREREFLQSASQVFVMGPSTKAVLTSPAYGLEPGRVHVVGAGPNCTLTASRPAGGRCRRLLFVGTHWTAKGGPQLLEAFARLRESEPELQLTVVGSAPDGKVPPGVNVLGRVPPSRMDDLYSKADALVIPTHVEAFGISFVEALAKGLPCIGTTVGNQPWIMRDAGICVQPGDVGALVVALTTLLRDYARLQRAALARGAVLRRELTWNNVARAILEFLPRCP